MTRDGRQPSEDWLGEHFAPPAVLEDTVGQDLLQAVRRLNKRVGMGE